MQAVERLTNENKKKWLTRYVLEGLNINETHETQALERQTVSNKKITQFR